jgi:hypothetical protein
MPAGQETNKPAENQQKKHTNQNKKVLGLKQKKHPPKTRTFTHGNFPIGPNWALIKPPGLGLWQLQWNLHACDYCKDEHDDNSDDSGICDSSGLSLTLHVIFILQVKEYQNGATHHKPDWRWLFPLADLNEVFLERDGRIHSWSRRKTSGSRRRAFLLIGSCGAATHRDTWSCWAAEDAGGSCWAAKDAGICSRSKAAMIVNTGGYPQCTLSNGVNFTDQNNQPFQKCLSPPDASNEKVR